MYLIVRLVGGGRVGRLVVGLVVGLVVSLVGGGRVRSGLVCGAVVRVGGDNDEESGEDDALKVEVHITTLYSKMTKKKID